MNIKNIFIFSLLFVCFSTANGQKDYLDLNFGKYYEFNMRTKMIARFCLKELVISSELYAIDYLRYPNHWDDFRDLKRYMKKKDMAECNKFEIKLLEKGNYYNSPKFALKGGRKLYTLSSKDNDVRVELVDY